MYICFPAVRGHIRLLQNKLGCDTQVNVVHRRRRRRAEEGGVAVNLRSAETQR